MQLCFLILIPQMDNPYVEVDLFGPSNSSPTQLDAKMTKLKHSIFLHSFFATLETIQLVWFSHKHLLWFLEICPKKFKFIRCPCLNFLNYGLCKNIWDMFAKHLIQIHSNWYTNSWNMSCFFCNISYINKSLLFRIKWLRTSSTIDYWT